MTAATDKLAACRTASRSDFIVSEPRSRDITTLWERRQMYVLMIVCVTS